MAPAQVPPSAPRGSRRGRATRAVLVGTGTLGLLLVVAAASSADRLLVPTAPAHLTLPTPLTGGLATLGAVGLVLAIELVLAALVFSRLFVTRPGPQGQRLGAWRRILESMGPFVFVVLVVVLITVLQQFAGVRRRPPSAAAANGVGRGLRALRGAGGGQAGFLSWNQAVVVATVVAAGLIAAATLVWVARLRAQRRVARALGADSAEPAAWSLHRTRRRSPRTPSEVIWCAVHDLEERCAAWGSPRHAHEGPRTFLGRAVPDPAGRGPAAERLAALYERARFSEHEVDDGAARSAMAAAQELGDAIRGPRAPRSSDD